MDYQVSTSLLLLTLERESQNLKTKSTEFDRA